MEPGYTRLYADSRHSGSIKAVSDASGVRVWAKPIAEQPETEIGVRLLLCSGSHVFVDGVKSLLAFDRDGRRLWERPKRYASPVAVDEDRVYFMSPDYIDRLQAVSFDNQLILDDMPILGMIRNASPVMFEPFADGLIMQIWDPGIVEEASDNFIVYKMLFEGSGFEWCQKFFGQQSRVMPLVSWEAKRVVTSLQEEALIFDVDTDNNEPEPLARFPFPLADATMWVSCGEDGVLYWSGYGENGLEVAATDFEGNQLWRWSAQTAGPGLGRPIVPPIIAPEAIYILTPAYLFALKVGEPLWNHFSPASIFKQATALEDGTVLISAAKGLYRIAPDGSLVFELELEDPLVTAPVIDDQGRIYAASEEKLYAFD
jgi:outer membrane protein assembly factor BamB